MIAEFASFEFGVARYYAARLVASSRFRSADLEDLIQEIVLDIWRCRHSFDSARGSWKYFVWRVARNRAADLFAIQKRRSCEINAADFRRDTEEIEALDTIQADQAIETAKRSQLQFEVLRVLEDLPPQLRLLAQLLQQMAISDVCKCLQKSRASVHRLTVLLRSAFVEAGFGEGRRRHEQSLGS